MNTVKLCRKSWHYWLASNLGGDDPDSYAMKRKTRDFCAYSRAVFANLILLLILTSAAIVLITPLFILPIYVLISHNYNHNIIEAIKAAWGGMGVGSLGIGLVWMLCILGRLFRNLSDNEKSPSFVGLWLRSIKSKICFLVEFKE